MKIQERNKKGDLFMNTMYLDNYLDFAIVVESMTEPNKGFELIH